MIAIPAAPTLTVQVTERACHEAVAAWRSGRDGGCVVGDRVVAGSAGGAGGAGDGYTVTSSPGGLTCSTSGATSCTVSGLTAGTSYRFRVTATNRIGTSPASGLSNAVVPTAPPGAPEMVPVVPARLLETRRGRMTRRSMGCSRGAGRRRRFGVGVDGDGSCGVWVPADASAVMLNVTAVFPSVLGI